jgi:hypothetical protein
MPKTGTQIKAGVIRQFGDDSGAQLIDADFIRWINEGQLEIFRGTEEGRATVTIPSVAGQAAYTLPVGFHKAISVEYNGTKLVKTSEQMVDQQNPTRSTGNATPRYYYVNWGEPSSLVVYPNPSVVASLVILYQARPVLLDDMADSTTISDAFMTTLETFCLAKAKQLDGDLPAYNALMAEVNGRVSKDFADAKDPFDDLYPFITTVPE